MGEGGGRRGGKGKGKGKEKRGRGTIELFCLFEGGQGQQNGHIFEDYLLPQLLIYHLWR